MHPRTPTAVRKANHANPRLLKNPRSQKQRPNPEQKRQRRSKLKTKMRTLITAIPAMVMMNDYTCQSLHVSFIHAYIHLFLPYDSARCLLYPLRGTLRGPHVYLDSSTSCDDYLFLLTTLLSLFGISCLILFRILDPLYYPPC